MTDTTYTTRDEAIFWEVEAPLQEHASDFDLEGIAAETIDTNEITRRHCTTCGRPSRFIGKDNICLHCIHRTKNNN